MSNKNARMEDLDVTEQAEVMAKERLDKREESKREFAPFVYALGIAGPVFAFFQAFSAGLFSSFSTSISYWIIFLFVALMWFGYGFYYKNKAIMIGYGLWIIAEIAMISGMYL